MSRDDLSESLMGEICYVIDILPTRVPEERFHRFLEMESYYLQEKELESIIKKFANIVVKMQCYHEFEIFCESWYENVTPQELTKMVRSTVMSKNGLMNILCIKDNMMLTVNGQTLHMSVYNPPLGAIANLSMLATAEGLFMRRSEN